MGTNYASHVGVWVFWLLFSTSGIAKKEGLEEPKEEMTKKTGENPPHQFKDPDPLKMLDVWTTRNSGFLDSIKMTIMS